MNRSKSLRQIALDALPLKPDAWNTAKQIWATLEPAEQGAFGKLYMIGKTLDGLERTGQVKKGTPIITGSQPENTWQRAKFPETAQPQPAPVQITDDQTLKNVDRETLFPGGVTLFQDQQTPTLDPEFMATVQTELAKCLGDELTAQTLQFDLTDDLDAALYRLVQLIKNACAETKPAIAHKTEKQRMLNTLSESEFIDDAYAAMLFELKEELDTLADGDSHD